MKITYKIISVGYDGGPEFATLAAARADLACLARRDLGKARVRFGRATLYRPTRDSYAVKIGGKDSTSLWSAASILSF